VRYLGNDAAGGYSPLAAQDLVDIYHDPLYSLALSFY
jgi:hypothetical protein